MRWTRWSIPPASSMAATAQMTVMMIPMTDHGMALVESVCTPVAASTSTPAPPARPIPMPPSLDPMTMNAMTMSKWTQNTVSVS